MTNRVYSVAIDGPAGAGKSSIAKRVAQRLGFVYADTGAIYRTVAYAVLQAGNAADDAVAVAALLPSLSLRVIWRDANQHMLLNGRDITDEIRSRAVSHNASVIAEQPAVRQFLLETQREIARTNSVIMDGRDIGTVVLPDADVKIFLTASAEVRAMRRFLELRETLPELTFDTVLAELKERDLRDSQREIAPLRCAEDAILIDTSDLTLPQSIEAITRCIQERLGL